MKYNKAFSLIELSMVMIIIGLLLAGVIGGGALLKQAKINSIASDFNKYALAVETFKIAYRKYPGDFHEAYTYWGNDCNSDADICNGDGDGRVEIGTAFTNEDSEVFMVWKHLQLAGMVDEAFTGLHQSNIAAVDTNIPGSKMVGIGFMILYGSNYNNGSALTFNKNALILGKPSATAHKPSYDPFISPRDAKILDKKLDDGISDTGKLRGYHALTDNLCTVVTTKIYNTIGDAGKTKSCYMLYNIE
jgi:prepilin-type N-terminal cleavage/methylation domain-containing protein